MGPGARFEVFRDSAGEWRWRLQAPNNEIVAQSEGYEDESSAVIGVGDAVRNFGAACGLPPHVCDGLAADAQIDPVES